MRRHMFLALASLAALTVASTSARAGVVLANPSSFNGAEILFNTPDSITSGTSLLGFTNSDHTGYRFEGTTITGPGGTTGNLLFAPSGGQAVVTADGYSTNKYPRLTSLTYYRDDGGTFDTTEFKLEDLANFVRNQSLQVQLFAWDQNSVMYDLGFLTLGGDNRFGIQGTGGDTISRVRYVVTGGGVGRHKQTRVDNAVSGAVPEPATWMMMLFGFGAMGATMRNRKRYNLTKRIALPNAI